MRSLDLVGGTEIVPVERCFDLLRGESVGRVAVVVDGEVEIFPVNYVVDGDQIVIASNVGRKMSGMLDCRLTFEVDTVDVAAQAGWSVIVHGVVEGIEPYGDGDHSGRDGHLLPQPWAGPKRLLIQVRPEKISGRRVSAGDWIQQT